ncbi:hypothetical protein Tco_1420945 [Tanacetum coccineum]
MDANASRSTSLFEQVTKLRNYMRTKAKTSRKWKKWFERQPRFSWSLKSEPAKMTSSVTMGRDNAVSHSRTPIPIKKWVFSIWKAFGGNTRDLGSFGEETDKTTDLHQHLSRLCSQLLETASQITRDAVTTLTKTASQESTTASECTTQPII